MAAPDDEEGEQLDELLLLERRRLRVLDRPQPHHNVRKLLTGEEVGRRAVAGHLPREKLQGDLRAHRHAPAGCGIGRHGAWLEESTRNLGKEQAAGLLGDAVWVTVEQMR